MKGVLVALLVGLFVLASLPRSLSFAQTADDAAQPAKPPPPSQAVPEAGSEVVPEPSAPSTPAAPAALPPPPETSLKAAKPTLWQGPRVELAYRLYSLSDDQGGGAVSSACFSGFLPTRYVRAGGGLEAGGRAYEYGPTEGLMSGNIFVGYQHLHDLGRVLPYVVAVGELGVVFGKRFHTPVSNAIRGAGVEIGADVNLVRSLYVGLGLSFMVYTMDGLAYDTFGLRLSIGL